MNSKLIVSLCVAALLATAALTWSQGAEQSAQAKADPRIDKVLEQNEQILKNQAEILKNQGAMLKSLEQLETGVMQLRRRP